MTTLKINYVTETGGNEVAEPDTLGTLTIAALVVGTSYFRLAVAEEETT